MSKTFKRFFAGLLAFVLVFAMTAAIAPAKEVKADFGRAGKFEMYLLDAEHDGELVGTVTDTVFTMPNHSCILLKEI